jgi:hypothetical protein
MRILEATGWFGLLISPHLPQHHGLAVDSIERESVAWPAGYFTGVSRVQLVLGKRYVLGQR